MDGVNKTLYFPLYGKASVSKKGILLKDPKAEEIWEKEGFALKGKAASKWLAYYMGMRSRVFDRWTEGLLQAHPEAVVLHIGCGLDSRCQRILNQGQPWYDLDFPEVIRERQKYFRESEDYHMIPGDMRQIDWQRQIPEGEEAIVVMEGISMYVTPQELAEVLRQLGSRFAKLHLLMDVYTTFAAKATKYKNPINEVGVTQVYGMDDPRKLAEESGLHYLQEHALTPLDLIAQLSPMERVIFTNLFAGKLARKIYRLYEFESKKETG